MLAQTMGSVSDRMRGFRNGGFVTGDVTVGGLENDSAFCFMNSVLQSMASLDGLDGFLGGTEFKAEVIEEVQREEEEEPDSDEMEEEEEVSESCNLPPAASAASADEMTPPEAEDDTIVVDEVEETKETAPEAISSLELSSLIPGFPPKIEEADTSTVTVKNPAFDKSLAEFSHDTGLGQFSYELKRMFAQLNTLQARSHTYSGLPITRAMGKSGQRWDGYEQEDAGEFFQQLIDKLEGEVKKRDAGSATPTTAASSDVTPNSLSTWKQKMLIPFDGVQATTIMCLECGDKGDGIRYNIMGALGLSLPNQTNRFSRSTHTLRECIDMFAEKEIIDGVSCERCSLREYKRQVQLKISELASSENAGAILPLFEQRLDKVQTALDRAVIDENEYNDIFKKGKFAKVFVQKSKQTLIAEPPKIMCVTINRSQFDMNTGMSFKNSANVRFPSLLCLDEWTETETTDSAVATVSPKYMYRLKSVVSHYGSHDYGHYIAYRYSRNKWWRISDETVYQTELSYVLSDGSIFMLFYELAPQEEAASLYQDMVQEQEEAEGRGVQAMPSESEEESDDDSDEDVRSESSEEEEE